LLAGFGAVLVLGLAAVFAGLVAFAGAALGAAARDFSLGLLMFSLQLLV
jgi:hypothetical protein